MTVTLGKKLKSLRADHNFSQPELAEIIGIEQSYLSKLENDKSLPSNDIFNKILTAFNLNVEQFLADFAVGPQLDTLKQIPDVAQHFSLKQKVNVAHQRRFMYISSLLIVLATTLFYCGYSKLLFPNLQYQYESEGVILEGENEDIFHNWRRLMAIDSSDDRKAIEKRQLEMEQRRQETIVISPTNRGKQFIIEVEDGYRKYELDSPIVVPQAVNAWLQILGVMLFSAGIMGFVLERRLFK